MSFLFARGAAQVSGTSAAEPQGDALVDPRDTAKYLLRVTAGPSYDARTHGQVQVNGAAYQIDSARCTAEVRVRIRDYHGLPRSSPASDAYFSHARHKDDRYSISFSIRPKADVPGAEMVMGFDFDRPIRDRLPPLFRPALKLVTTVIDPGIYCDAYADKPYLYGPGLSSFFILRIGDKAADAQSGGEQQEEEQQADTASKRRSQVVVEEGGDGEGRNIRDALGMPENSDKRRRWFLKQKNLDAFTFEAGREYEADFFNPYLDFTNFAVRLPGFSISIAKYIDEKTHELRYVLKNKRTDEVYFVVVFTLLFGQQLKDALQEEKGGQESGSSIDAGNLDNGGDEHDFSDEQDVPAKIRDASSSSDGVSPGQQDQYLSPSTSQDGLVSSLSKWLPRMLRSGGTASGRTTPGSATPNDERGRSMDEERSEVMSDEKAEDEINELSDASISETLRARHVTGQQGQ